MSKSKNSQRKNDQQHQPNAVSKQPTSNPSQSKAPVTSISVVEEKAMPQTMQQQRAKFALTAVLNDSNNKEINPSKYKSYVSSLPFMIKANGLGQAAAFYHSKSKDDKIEARTYKLIYDLLSNWLVGKEYHKIIPPLNQPFHGEQGLLEGITNANMQTYLAAQAEAMIFLQWVKQFANAFMENSKNDSST